MQDDLDRGLAHHRAGHLQKAEAIYRAVLARQPAHADALHLLGVLAHQRGAHAEAVTLIDRAIQVAPRTATYHVNRGEALRALGWLDDAIVAYQEALALKPDYALAHSNLGLALQDLGDAAAAESAYRRALALVADAETCCNLGDVLREQGRLAEALAVYEHALALRPHFAEAHNNRGAVLWQLGRLKEALTALERAVALKPGYAEAYYNLGITLDEDNHRRAAIAAYREALSRKPDFVEASHRLGLALERDGELDKAIAVYRRALDSQRDAQIYNDLGRVLLTKGDPRGAASVYRQALAVQPDFAETYHNLGNALVAAGHFSEAIVSYHQALEINPDDAVVHYHLGNAYWERADLEAACASYRQALALKSDLAAAHNNLGNVLVALGRMGEASESYRNALCFQPEHAEALANLVNIERYDSAEHRDVHTIEALLSAQDLPEQDAIRLNFALGKILDDCGLYDEAFTHYEIGNRLKRKHLVFDLPNLIEGVDRSMRVFDRAFFDARPPCGSSSELPVFIVGMPRSGTTLVEQIISSHPRVHGTGESAKIRDIADELTHTFADRAPYPDCIRYADRDMLSTWAGAYENYLRRAAPLDVYRVSDKTPLNLLHLGLVALLFPRARVIHCLRDPLDTCLSIYFQNFTTSNDYAYDLAEIGSYYRECERLMVHWHATLPLRMCEICYEDLLSDPEANSKRLIEFLDIAWDPNCLAFHRNPRPVRTASAWQVRQPVYRSAVGRWRNYEEYLGPLKKALGTGS
jgi:tetratricopeptide (TPR) repeat protein